MKTRELNELIDPYDPDEALRAINDRLEKLGFIEVQVEDLSFDLDGGIVVTFSSDEEAMQVVFIYESGDSSVIIIDDEEDEYSDDDESEIYVLDINSYNPPIIKALLGSYIDLRLTKWMTVSFFNSIFQAADLETEYVEDDGEEDLGEARKTYVVRGGKKVRVTLVRRLRKKRLTPKQKSGYRKAVRSRKTKMAKINRTRKKSLRVRKRLSLKSGGKRRGEVVRK